ncbi:modification methylase [Candidatus Nomurabacteria bacterium RIFOXYC2_FULL_36_19]|uniref:Modification methylase n=1 Tax=Candidatus Nomurabacteria bacterium RIFOXYC2_FULL_36_19 TaxID=1801806 RepID=A0A1F6YWA7_9BACT|nr:MAG: modification methylase [Candidatus Nomurabacteria bacterium RIFOXYA2_FULL_35_9]OGJ10636.1 MAG: modification methylase [Candidatus Nomurabacteria bacterium RIFOXYC2_FULL_36_19]OGJ14694.1 MAG: modification methylase [Candidatus Nomurabacteria bacterium RIFOXYD2_FULL_35_12]
MKKTSSNKNLKKANTAKSDEFYTQISDIEKELGNYKKHLKNKVIFCNCDDPEESHFWKYFAENFEHLGLKKLVSTHYKDANLFTKESPYKLEIVKDANKDGKINKLDTIKTPLKQNGDFRSSECIEILKEADIVVTNPPFSLFREYLAQLFEYKKKFIIIGNLNAITYKETFKLIKENKIWLGQSIHSGDREFRVPEYYPLNSASNRIDENGNKYIRVKGVRWFTNLDYKERHEDLILYKTYRGHESEYPKYDNYNAINVDITKDIPVDYKGAIGVPITFLDKYNPDQFEIVGLGNSRDNFTPNKNYFNPYKVMRDGEKKNGNAINCVLAIESQTKPDDIYYISKNSKYLIAPYARILIKNKKI